MCPFGLSKWVKLVHDFMPFLKVHVRKRSKMAILVK